MSLTFHLQNQEYHYTLLLPHPVHVFLRRILRKTCSLLLDARLHLVSVVRLTRKGSTAPPSISGTQNVTIADVSMVLLPNSSRKREKGFVEWMFGRKGERVKSCLSQPSLPRLPGKRGEREADVVVSCWYVETDPCSSDTVNLGRPPVEDTAKAKLLNQYSEKSNVRKRNF